MTNPADLEQLVSVERAAAALDVSYRTLRRLIERDELAAVRVGNRLRVRQQDLVEFIERRGAVAT
jgi:excisionase family DNA binding protein